MKFSCKFIKFFTFSWTNLIQAAAAIFILRQRPKSEVQNTNVKLQNQKSVVCCAQSSLPDASMIARWKEKKLKDNILIWN